MPKRLDIPNDEFVKLARAKSRERSMKYYWGHKPTILRTRKVKERNRRIGFCVEEVCPLTGKKAKEKDTIHQQILSADADYNDTDFDAPDLDTQYVDGPDGDGQIENQIRRIKSKKIKRTFKEDLQSHQLNQQYETPRSKQTINAQTLKRMHETNNIKQWTSKSSLATNTSHMNSIIRIFNLYIQEQDRNGQNNLTLKNVFHQLDVPTIIEVLRNAKQEKSDKNYAENSIGSFLLNIAKLGALNIVYMNAAKYNDLVAEGGKLLNRAQSAETFVFHFVDALELIQRVRGFESKEYILARLHWEVGLRDNFDVIVKPAVPASTKKNIIVVPEDPSLRVVYILVVHKSQNHFPNEVTILSKKLSSIIRSWIETNEIAYDTLLFPKKVSKRTSKGKKSKKKQQKAAAGTQEIQAAQQTQEEENSGQSNWIRTHLLFLGLVDPKTLSITNNTFRKMKINTEILDGDLRSAWNRPNLDNLHDRMKHSGPTSENKYISTIVRIRFPDITPEEIVQKHELEKMYTDRKYVEAKSTNDYDFGVYRVKPIPDEEANVVDAPVNPLQAVQRKKQQDKKKRAKKAQDKKKAASTSSQAATQSSQAATQSSQAATTSSQAATQSSQAASTSSQAASTSSQAPKSMKAAPKSMKAAPKSTKAAPKSTKAAPKSTKAASKPRKKKKKQQDFEMDDDDDEEDDEEDQTETSDEEEETDDEEDDDDDDADAELEANLTDEVEESEEEDTEEDQDDFEDPPKSSTKASQGLYLVDKLLQKKQIKGKTHYLVKWDGDYEATWQPPKNIVDKSLITQLQQRLKQGTSPQESSPQETSPQETSPSPSTVKKRGRPPKNREKSSLKRLKKATSPASSTVKKRGRQRKNPE